MKILKFKKFTGLHIVRQKCGRHIEVSQTQYNGCIHPIERQKYKAALKANEGRKARDLKFDRAHNWNNSKEPKKGIDSVQQGIEGVIDSIEL